MINRNKMKYTKLKNVSKKKTNKLSIIEKTERTLKRKLNNKKKSNLKGKVNSNKKKKKIKSKFKERTKLLLDGKKITKKGGRVGGAQPPKITKTKRKISSIKRGLETYQSRPFSRNYFSDGTKIKSAWNPFVTSSGRKIANRQKYIDTYQSQLNRKTHKINEIKKELKALSSLEKPPTPEQINRVKQLSEKLRAKEKSLEGLKKNIDKKKTELVDIQLKQQNKSQGFNRWRINKILRINKYSTKNLDKTLKNIENGKYAFFTRGRRGVIKNMTFEGKTELRNNINEINRLKTEGTDKINGTPLTKEEIKRAIKELNIKNAQLYRKGILQQKINSASRRGYFTRKLDKTKQEVLEGILQNTMDNPKENPLTKNFMKKANLQIEKEKIDIARKKLGDDNFQNQKFDNLEKKLKKLNETDEYKGNIIKKAEKSIELSSELSKGISTTQGEIANTKAEVAISDIQGVLDKRRINRISNKKYIPFSMPLSRRFNASRKLSKTVSELEKIINNENSSPEQKSKAKKRLTEILEIAGRSGNTKLKNTEERLKTQETRKKEIKQANDLIKDNAADPDIKPVETNILNILKNNQSADKIQTLYNNSYQNLTNLRKQADNLRNLNPTTEMQKQQIAAKLKEVTKNIENENNNYLNIAIARRINKLNTEKNFNLEASNLQNMLEFTIKNQSGKNIQKEDYTSILKSSRINFKQNYNREEIYKIFGEAAKSYNFTNPITQNVNASAAPVSTGNQASATGTTNLTSNPT